MRCSIKSDGGFIASLLLSWSSLQQFFVLVEVIPRVADCHRKHHPGPKNPSFEQGLDGWTVVEGNAFGPKSISSESTYWGGSFNKICYSFLWGFPEAGDAGTGSLKSSTFKANSVMSFLIGGGWDENNLHVSLVRDSDGKTLLRQTGLNDEAVVLIVWDTSDFASQNVHLFVYDNRTREFGHISLDDPTFVNNTANASGLFTESAITNKDTGRMQLVYTDFTDINIHPGAVAEVQSSATSQNGIDFNYFPANPVIKAPPPGSAAAFRDPKVFWDFNDRTCKMVIGSGDSTGSKVQLYVSTSPKGSEQVSWKYVGVVYQGYLSRGTIYECPNVFPIGKKLVLFYGAIYLNFHHVGTFNETTFISKKTGLADTGPDSHAMPWYVDQAGRDLAITWLGNWPTSKWPSRVNGWAGVQSITRELFIREDGGLGNRPIKELSSLHKKELTSWRRKEIRGSVEVVSSNTAHLQLSVDQAASNAFSFNVTIYGSSAESAVLTYDFASKTLSLDTTNAGYGQAGVWKTEISPTRNKKLTLDIFIDRSSLEVFVGDGTVLSMKVTPRYQESTDIKIISNGGKTVFDNVSLTSLDSS